MCQSMIIYKLANLQIKEVYGDVKIPFPNFVTFSVNRQTQTGIRRMLQALSHITAKSNAEKAELYLQRCLLDAAVGKSSILRDFLSPQREEDTFIPVSTSSSTPAPQSPVPISIASDDQDAVVPDDTFFEDVSSFSLGSRQFSSHCSDVDYIEDSISDLSDADKQYRNNCPETMSFSDMSSLNDISQKLEDLGKSVIDEYDLLKVLGQGCMGKASTYINDCSRYSISTDQLLYIIGFVGSPLA